MAKKRKGNKKKFVSNKAASPKTKIVHCRTVVNRDSIRRESIDGVEHIVITSFTLPADIVMNGGFYSEAERNASFHSLEDTLAPIEHPTDSDGNFLFASSGPAIHNFHAGAFNKNVEIDEATNRIKIDKFINVQVAKQTDRGKRLLDRIEEIETNDNARPIHTSVAALLEVEEHDELQVNAAGQEFSWSAHNIQFDHDAILLDSVGAAQPHQGVGIGINAKKEKIDVVEFTVNDESKPDHASDNRITANQMSFHEVERMIDSKLNENRLDGEDWKWSLDIFDNFFIFADDGGLFRQSYLIVENEIQFVDQAAEVVRDPVTYTLKLNQTRDNPMKEMILNALKAAGIETEGLTDAELYAKHNELLMANANAESDDNTSDADAAASEDATGIADVVANAIKPLIDKIDGLETIVNSGKDEEKKGLVSLISNSGKYDGMSADTLAKLDVDELKKMAANCETSHGLSVVNRSNSGDAGEMKFELAKEA